MESIIAQGLALKLFLVMSSLVCVFAAILSMVALYKQSVLNRSLDRFKRDLNKLDRDNLQLTESFNQIVANQNQHLDVLKDHAQHITEVSTAVNKLSDKLHASDSRISRVEVRDSQTGSYQHAAKLVELGAQQEEVAQTCGLSRAEADLVALVNRHHNLKSKLNNQSDNEDQQAL